MNVVLDYTYTVKLNNAEFRLIGLALSGQPLNKADAQACLELNERMCALRVQELKQASEVAVGAHTKAAGSY